MTRHTPEQVIPKVRQAEADLAQGLSIAQVCQKLGVSEQTLHRWRNQYGGLKADEAKRLKELEAENARLKRLVAELSLDKQMLQEVVQKKSGECRPAPPGGAAPAAGLRGVPAAGLPHRGPAPLDPACATSPAEQRGAEAAPAATDDRPGAPAVGLADGTPAAAPRRAAGQSQADPSAVARGRAAPPGPLPQAPPRGSWRG